MCYRRSSTTRRRSMNVVKHPLSLGETVIEVPSGSQFLSVVAKSGGAVAYFAQPDADGSEGGETLTFYAAETGGSVPDNALFVGSVRERGSHTWHVWQTVLVPDALPPELA